MSTKTLQRGAIALAAASLLFCAGARADGIYIRVPAPPVPHIVLSAPPPMVWLPSIGIYVAHESPYPIFFLDGRYYLRDHDRWFAAHAYGGPWGRVDDMRLPPPLRRYHDRDWDRYQHEAGMGYRRNDDRMHPMFYPGRRDGDRYQERDFRRGRDFRGNDDYRGRGHGRDDRRGDFDR